MNNLETSSQSHWIPLSDLMTGLMMIFMLLTAMYMLRVEQTTTLIVQEHQKTKAELVRALQETFKDDLKQWDAKFLGDMTLRFNNPEVLFATGKSELKPEFKAILVSFIPRYISIINDPKFKSAIKEIRIEGHTSPVWTGATTEQAYFNNMALSQSRTLAALEFILKMPEIQTNADWMKAHLTANGLSSSKPILKSNNEIDEKASQRVEFRIVTNAEDSLDKIADSLVIK
jgi:outer membrane protein OmpA-like peptidoglycan-associated protein